MIRDIYAHVHFFAYAKKILHGQLNPPEVYYLQNLISGILHFRNLNGQLVSCLCGLDYTVNDCLVIEYL